MQVHRFTLPRPVCGLHSKVCFHNLRPGLHHRRHRCPAIRPNSTDDRPSLLEIFSAVSEGRLSPVDAAQTVEEAITQADGAERPKPETFPVVLNGRRKRAEWIGRRMTELLERQGRALATEITPAAYAEIRKSVPGVVYHAGARTLRADRAEGKTPKLPGSVGIVSDESVPPAAVEELRNIGDYLGFYTFQVRNLSVSRLNELVDHMQSAAQASAVVVLYDEDQALPDVIAASVDAPIISVRLGESGFRDLPSGTLAAKNVVHAAFSVAKILKSVSHVHSLQAATEIPAPLEDVVVRTASLDEQIHDALKILEGEAVEKLPDRVNNVVSSEVSSEAPIDVASKGIY